MARDTNFYYSFLVLPADKRRAIVAVWDFCRAVDDAVDDISAGDAARGPIEIARWRRELAACFGAGVPETPQGRALVPVIAQFGLSRAPFEALIEGVEMDIGAPRDQTFDDLYQYCIRVASAVGLMCLEIFGETGSRARQYATDLGVALQLTNILRDVAGDLERGRVYLPQEDLRRHGVTEADLAEEGRLRGRGIQNSAVRALLRDEARRAREYYARAAEALAGASARRLVAAEIMGAIYRSLLDRIERRDYDVFTSVVRVPRPRRALIAAVAWARAATGL